jgi:lipoate-protein ligase A
MRDVMKKQAKAVCMELFLVRSSSYDPWFNLGLEEYFFRAIPEGSVLFYLWQNERTVVIGRSQNAWRECRVEKLEADGGKLARRSTGGGAVYHDLGNLCYSFIGKGGTYDLEKQTKTIQDAVNSFGINAQFTGRNDITVEGKKISGNAFKFEKETGLMHGTLLVDVDIETLGEYLTAPRQKLESKGVKSVKSRVANLKEYVKDINIEKLSRALCGSFRARYGEYTDLGTYGFDQSKKVLDMSKVSKDAFDLGFAEPEKIAAFYDKYSSWDFRLGENPSFDISSIKHLDWGTVEIALSSSKGLITACAVYTDANQSEFAESLTEALRGSEYGFESVKDKIKRTCPPDIAENMCEMVKDMF